MTLTMRHSVDHEAAHVAAAAILGLKVLGAEVTPDGAGSTWLLPDDRQSQWREIAIVALLGHMQDGRKDWPPRGLAFTPWSPDGHDLLAVTGNVSHDEYLGVVDDAWVLFRSGEYARIQPLVAGELGRGRIDKPVIDLIAQGVQ
jgi:hypothetical protein